LGALALASAAGIAAFAGRVCDVRAALVYDITLGAGAQVNDNLYLDPPESGEGASRLPVQETIFALYPGIMVAWQEQRDLVRLRYNGEYWAFTGDEDREPLWVNHLAANLTWRRWTPFFLEAGELLDRIPRSQQREGVAVVDQIDRSRLSVRTGLAWDLGPRGAAELAYRGGLVTFPGAEAADRVSSQYGEGVVRYRWSPLVGSDVRVAYGQVNRELAADYTELSAAAAVDQRLSERLALRYRLQWIRTSQDEPAAAEAGAGEPADNTRTTLLKAAELRGTLSLGGTWKLAYEDRQEDRPDGDTLEVARASAAVALRARLGSTLDIGAWYERRSYLNSGREEEAWGPTLNPRWMITPWAGCDLALDWTNTTLQDQGLPSIEDRTTRVAAGIVVRVLSHLQLEAGCRYLKNNSAAAERSYSNTILYAVVTYSFAPIPPGRLLPSHTARLFISSDLVSTGTGQQDAGGGAAPGH
jgi:hypothetical protein